MGLNDKTSVVTAAGHQIQKKENKNEMHVEDGECVDGTAILESSPELKKHAHIVLVARLYLYIYNHQYALRCIFFDENYKPMCQNDHASLYHFFSRNILQNDVQNQY